MTKEGTTLDKSQTETTYSASSTKNLPAAFHKCHRKHDQKKKIAWSWTPSNAGSLADFGVTDYSLQSWWNQDSNPTKHFKQHH